MKQFALRLVAVALGMLVLASCSEAPSSKPKTQVAAVVNGVEITQRELDSIYKKLEVPGTPPKEAAAKRRALLAELVRIEALAQQAATDKLDATPDYMVEAHVANRKLLATQIERAAAQKAEAAQVQPARDFVAANPRIFTQRQLLILESLVFATPDPKLITAVEESINKGAAPAQIEEIIRAATTDVHPQLTSLTSERLPTSVLAKLYGAKPGTMVVIKQTEQRAEVFALRAAYPAEIKGDAAIEAATMVISSELKQRAIKERVEAVLNTTKITYFGEFAPGAAGATPNDLPLGGMPLALSQRRTAALMSGLGMAGFLVTLLMFASTRYWQGGLLPMNAQMAFAKSMDGASHGPIVVNPMKKASAAGKILLMLAWVALLVMMGALVVKGEQKLGPLLAYSMAAIGVVLGAAASYWFVHSPLRELTRNVRWAPVVTFALLLAGTCGAGIWIV